jgi:hypothetical protein
MAAQHKLDIFDTLTAIDRRDFGFLERQQEDARKGFAGPVVLRWASAVGNGEMGDYMLLMVNAKANLNFFDIGDHPDLQYRLLAASGVGSKQRHQWIAMPSRKRSANALHDFLSKYWPDASDLELDILLGQFTRESFTEFVHECGLDPKMTTEAVGLYDKLTGHKSDGRKKKAKAEG